MINSKLASKQNEDVSLIVTVDNHKGVYVCDCGEASDISIKEYIDTKAIFISHTHIDHFINFDSFIRHQIGSPFHTVVCGPFGLSMNVYGKLLSYNWNLISDKPKGEMCYEVREYINEHSYRKTSFKSPLWLPEESEIIESPFIYENDAFTVSAMAVDHKIESITYLFKEHDSVSIDLSKSPYKGGKWVSELKQAYLTKNDDFIINIGSESIIAKDLYYLLSTKHGSSLGFVMDFACSNDNTTKLVKQFMNVDTLYIESFYADSDKEFADINYHSTTKNSGKVAALASAKNAIPIHFSRKYDFDKQLDLASEFHKSYNEYKNE